MLEEQESCLSGLNREIVLDLLTLLPAEWWIGENDVVAILLLDVCQVLRQSIRVYDIRSVDPMQDHVHDADDEGKRLLLLAVEGRFLK